MLAKRLGLSALALVVAVQFVPVTRDNPPAASASAFYSAESVPAEVRSVIGQSCTNCHTNETVWPWYSYLAPFSWMVAHDVHQARGQLNFSEWNKYSSKKKEQKLEEICEQVMNGDMPDGKYLLMHRKAKLTQDQREAICNWTQSVPLE